VTKPAIGKAPEGRSKALNEHMSSGFAPRADIVAACRHVRFVPGAAIRGVLKSQTVHEKVESAISQNSTIVARTPALGDLGQPGDSNDQRRAQCQIRALTLLACTDAVVE
jgi:hypothetical protein